MTLLFSTTRGIVPTTSLDLNSHNLRTIYEKFFNEQAMVKLKGDRIQVTLYGHPRENKLRLMYYDLSSKLERKGIDPRVPWLNDHVMEFIFK